MTEKMKLAGFCCFGRVKINKMHDPNLRPQDRPMYAAEPSPAEVCESTSDTPAEIAHDLAVEKLVAAGMTYTAAHAAVTVVASTYGETATATGTCATHDEIVRLEATFREQLRCIAADDTPRPKLLARVYLLARGSGLDHGDTMRSLARAYNLSPEAISKQVEAARKKFNLPKNHHNKSDTACAKYRLANRRNFKNADRT